MSPSPEEPRPGRGRRRLRRAPPSTLAFALLACTVTGARMARAQDGASRARDLSELSLEDLMAIEVRQVVGASRREQSTLDAPSSVTVITGEEIRARQYRTLDEVLASLCGIHTTNDRVYRHTGVRGFSIPGDFNSRLLLLVDGHRLNDPIYASAAVGRESPIDLATIERVELIRGPGSALYGSNAVFGVVNVVTRRGADGPLLETEARGSSHDLYEAGARVGGATEGGTDYLVAVRGFRDAGDRLHFDEFSTTPSGGDTSGTDYESGFGVVARVTRDELSLSTGFTLRRKGIPTGQFGTVFDDPDTHLQEAQGYVDLAWRRISDSGGELSARVYYDLYRYKGWYVYDDTANGGPPDLMNRDDVRGQRVGAELATAFDVGEIQRLTLGGELLWNFQQDQHNYDFTTEYADIHSDSVDGGVFLQDEIALGSRTELVLGSRFDQYESFGGTWNPRAALIFHPDEETALKALFGTAFRAPNVWELEYEDAVTNQANPDLEPERITTYELVGERYFGDEARASASLYHYRVDDLIAQRVDTGTGLLVFDNIDEVRATGVELEAALVLTDGVRATLSQAFQEVRDEATGRRPPDSPRRITQARLEFELFDGACFAMLEGQFLGDRRTVSGSTVSAYGLVNVALRAPDVFPGVDLELACTNLLDADHADPGTPDVVQQELPQDGRRVMLGLLLRR